jgi:hypothetical protein
MRVADGSASIRDQLTAMGVDSHERIKQASF